MTVLASLRAYAEHTAKHWPHSCPDAAAKRRVIMEKVRLLRGARDCGGYFSVGRGGESIHGHNVTVSGYANASDPIIQAAIKAGVPGYDSTLIPSDHIHETMRFPMVRVGGNPDPLPESGRYHGFSYAPLMHVLSCYAGLGAKVWTGRPTIRNLDSGFHVVTLRKYGRLPASPFAEHLDGWNGRLSDQWHAKPRRADAAARTHARRYGKAIIFDPKRLSWTEYYCRGVSDLTRTVWKVDPHATNYEGNPKVWRAVA